MSTNGRLITVSNTLCCSCVSTIKTIYLRSKIMSINLGEWQSRLIGKKIIPIGGRVSDPSREYSEEDIKAAVPRYRILTPDSMYTMDYRTDRLNVHVDVDNNVQSVKIG